MPAPTTAGASIRRVDRARIFRRAIRRRCIRTASRRASARTWKIASLTVGGRTSLAGWSVDLSATHGRNRMDYIIGSTLNASIANADLLAGGRGISPTSFDAGGFSFTQNTVGLDVTRFFADAIEGINVAFGAESRRETYSIRAGERGSWDDYDGPGGGNAGSQGFPGFRPEDVIDKSRHAAAPTWTSKRRSRTTFCSLPRRASSTTATSAMRRSASLRLRTRSTMDCCCADRSAAVSARPRCSNSTSAPRSRTSCKAFRSTS